MGEGDGSVVVDRHAREQRSGAQTVDSQDMDQDVDIPGLGGNVSVGGTPFPVDGVQLPDD